MPKSDDTPGPETGSLPMAAGLLYRLTVAFPSWAGAIMAVYSLSVHGFSNLKIRLR